MTAASGKGFGKNAMYSGVSWLVPAVIAVIAVPITVKGLGVERYGVVTLVGAVAGYLGLLDLGLGQGIVRHLAMFVALRQGTTVRDCLGLMIRWFVGVGMVGAAALWVVAPWLATSLLHVPADMVSLTISAFRIGGISFAVGMIASVLSFLPESFLRYDVVALLNGIMASASLAGPAVLVSLGYGVLSVLWFYVGVNALACIAWGWVGFRLVRGLPEEGPPFREHLPAFIRFSSTVAANRVWGVVQTETSKVVVGAAGGIAQAGYFQVPSVITGRITSLLYKMSTVLLPTGSQLAAAGEHGDLLALYKRASRLFYLLNASLIAAVVVYADPLLVHWVGPEYGKVGSIAFVLLALAAGLNATSMAAGSINLALGRPRVNLVFSVINSLMNLGTVYFLTVRYGIAGTAASALFAALNVPVFLAYSHRKVLGVSSIEILRACYLRTTLAVAAAAALSWYLLRPLASSLMSTLLLLGITVIAGFLASAVAGVLTREDWAAFGSLFRSKAGRRAGSGRTATGDSERERE